MTEPLNTGDIASVTNAQKDNAEAGFSLTFSTDSGFLTAVNSLLRTNFTESKSAIAYLNNRQGSSIFGKMVATAMDDCSEFVAES